MCVEARCIFTGYVVAFAVEAMEGAFGVWVSGWLSEVADQMCEDVSPRSSDSLYLLTTGKTRPIPRARRQFR